MGNSESCPDNETLQRWNAGSLDGQLFESVCDHFEVCDACQKRLDKLDAPVPCLDMRIQCLTQMDLELARKSMESDLPTVRFIQAWISGTLQQPDSASI